MDSNIIRKIIFLSYLPLSPKIREDYLLDHLVAEGFVVEYWDMVKLFGFDHANVDDSEESSVRKISDYKQLRKMIRTEKLESTLFLSLMTYEWRVVRLHRILTRAGCITGRYGINMIPTGGGTQRSFFQKLLHITPRKLRCHVQGKLAVYFKKWGVVRPYDLLFCSSRQGHLGLGCGSKIDLAHARKVVAVNSTDYTTYQRIKPGNDRVIADNYILFLDEYLPLHPDFVMFNLPTIDADEYYRTINTFFTQLEARYGMPVVVAAHPKALQYKDRDFFEGRTVLFGQTAALVRDCSYVLAHGSTSIGFAVMFEKPVAVLLSETIDRVMPFYGDDFRAKGRAVGACLLFYDRPLPDTIELNIDTEAYQRYKYNYLTSPESESDSNYEIITRTFKTFSL